MLSWRIWLLPALLGAAQIAFWPGLAIIRGQPVEPVPASALVAVTVLAASALLWRRHAPVAVVAATIAAVGLAFWIEPASQFFAPGDATTVLSGGVLVALFSVAVWCTRRTTALVLVALAVGEAALTAARDGLTADYPADLVLGVVLNTLVAAAGRMRRRWTGARADAARRLAEAEQARAEAATVERRRLARELHDVTAHHLTSIVVNASAAQFLAEQRPELHAEALEFASRTGRETLTALHRLVAVLPAVPTTAPSLAGLADDFRQLGQAVTVRTTGEPPAGLAEVMHAIAREALTNALRYAAGGTVRLHRVYGEDGARLEVENDGGTATVPTAGLGGGRGLAGMRERAAAFGGTVESGPRSEGGWRVRAVFPPAGSRPRPATGRLRSQAVLDAGLVLLVLLLPLAGVAVLAEEGASPAAITLILLAVTAHAAPLLGRRRFPWTCLVVVALTGWLFPLLVATGVADSGGRFLFDVGADLAAVYAVAVHAARASRTWLAPVAALASSVLTFATLLLLEPRTGAEPTGALVAAVVFAFGAGVGAILLGVPVGGSWLAGVLIRRRRQRRLDRESGAVDVEVMHAAVRARDERARVAAGLRQAVLEHAARVPRAAEEADLPGVLVAAREALTAMRGLLDGLGGRDATMERQVPASPFG